MKRKGEYADRHRGVSMSCIHDQLMFVCLTLMLCFILIAYISFFLGLSVKRGGGCILFLFSLLGK